MDGVYQAVKSFLKSFVNLFVAIIELFTALINGIASFIGKLRLNISKRYAELKRGGSKSAETVGWRIKWLGESSLNLKNGEEMLVEKIRTQLNEKITSRNQYLFLYAKVKEQNTGINAIVLSVLALVLTGGIVVGGSAGSSEVCIFALIVMLLSCAAVCVIIIRNQKQEMYHKIAGQILEEEFSGRFRDETDEAEDIEQTVEEEDTERKVKNQNVDEPEPGNENKTSAEESALE